MWAGRVIVTADDFGLTPEVNAAVEIAHRDGVLTHASLMIGGPAAADAVVVARRNPALQVGLHLTLTDGAPMLPRAAIPVLTRADGRFRDDMGTQAVALAVSSAAQRQVVAEIAAQVAAFRATGLHCTHIDAHKHVSLHPVIGTLACRIAAAAGIRRVRVPWEPPSLVPGASWALWPVAAMLARAARRHGLWSADRVVGLAWSGAVTAERLLWVLPRLPAGCTEIYLHPATRDDIVGGGPGYRHRDELAALVDPRVRAALAG